MEQAFGNWETFYLKTGRPLPVREQLEAIEKWVSPRTCTDSAGLRSHVDLTEDFPNLYSPYTTVINSGVFSI
ncbi:hypothetical protein O181_019592 [Austropuccinia psidii MF-1]|uniref:Uncharacterized protein n=1 Tax=Austropuccinia psidii MF-1 TaxID=1389203 RepID=A0A9Q3GUK2_9BASI|nr:hypothetical protein [Austropuccinia psidii MF-1]